MIFIPSKCENNVGDRNKIGVENEKYPVDFSIGFDSNCNWSWIVLYIYESYASICREGRFGLP